MLRLIRSRSLSRGLMDGSRLWMALGVVAWLIKAYQWAVGRETEIVYRGELAPGETLVLARERTDTAKTRVSRRSRRR